MFFFFFYTDFFGVSFMIYDGPNDSTQDYDYSNSWNDIRFYSKAEYVNHESKNDA